nr:hypothetical protein [Candidatus Sigynarchaeota archaeon]
MAGSSRTLAIAAVILGLAAVNGATVAKVLGAAGIILGIISVAIQFYS